jgi:hypothetical protein
MVLSNEEEITGALLFQGIVETSDLPNVGVIITDMTFNKICSCSSGNTST